ncbi:hypothetical protein QQX98_004703 [Neonectria punicea]|uniref:Xylanolytic transcriptional activator regulatory domain-containing protein n=1 Tax=Neonectria punicea TaxID=979145 RepID=A0ABR1H897_9HYPO
MPNEGTSTDEHASLDGNYQLERIPWPKFMSYLRDIFSLDNDLPDDMNTSPPPPLNSVTIQPAAVSRLQKVIDGFPPRHIADYLLELSGSYGTDSFFYFDQAQFLADIDQFYNNPASPLRFDASFITLALAAFALGAQRTTMSGSRTSLPESSDDCDPGQVFFDGARPLIPDVIERSCLRAIQATFALGVFLLPQSTVELSYVYIGVALRKAVGFDLHRDTDDPSIPPREREVRSRLWWSIYSVER